MNQLDTLFSFMNYYLELTASDQELISNSVTKKSYSKGDILVHQGQTCKELKFVLSGIYRVYRIIEGKEITSYFSYHDRNPFVASFISLLSGTPSEEIVECLSDGDLLSIKYDDWKEFYSKSERINTFGRKMAELNYVLSIERIHSLQTINASERYVLFMKQYPNLLNLIPHHYIASYIGVTPESLSRIRKSMM